MDQINGRTKPLQLVVFFMWDACFFYNRPTNKELTRYADSFNIEAHMGRIEHWLSELTKANKNPIKFIYTLPEITDLVQYNLNEHRCYIGEDKRRKFDESRKVAYLAKMETKVRLQDSADASRS